MCGRFSQLLTWQETNDLFDLPDDAVPLNMQPRVNGAPTQDFVGLHKHRTVTSFNPQVSMGASAFLGQGQAHQRQDDQRKVRDGR